MRRLLVIPMVLSLLLSGALSAAADTTVDREPDIPWPSNYRSHFWWPLDWGVAARIVAPLTGDLTRIDVGLVNEGPPSSVTASVRALTEISGPLGSVFLPDDHILATATREIPGEFEHEWIRFDFPTPARLVAGETYAVVFSGSSPDVYAEGIPVALEQHGWEFYVPDEEWRISTMGTSFLNWPVRGWIDPVTEPVLSDFNDNFDGEAPISAKSGSTLPLRWRITRDGAPVSLDRVEVASNGNCGPTTGTPDVAETTAGKSGLIDQGDGYYQFNWKTSKGTSGCRNVTVTMHATDGTTVARTITVMFR